MVDLKQQYANIKNDVDEAIQEVIDNAAFINGKPVTEFADNLASYLGVKHVIPCANGTDALQIAMMALDLQPGDEVITPSFTYIATTEVIALLRLKPVLWKWIQKLFALIPRLLEKAITPKTKAIVPVHLYGQCCDMEAIMDIAAGIKFICYRRQCAGHRQRLPVYRRYRKKDRHYRHHRHHFLLPFKESGLLWGWRCNIHQ